MNAGHLAIAKGNISIFYGQKQSSAITATGWLSWKKPKGVNTINIVVIGGGGRSWRIN